MDELVVITSFLIIGSVLESAQRKSLAMSSLLRYLVFIATCVGNAHSKKSNTLAWSHDHDQYSTNNYIDISKIKNIKILNN